MAMNMPRGGGGGRPRASRRAPLAEINVTPLVDVMLVLLIIFMVTAPLLVAGVPVDLPDSKAAALDQEVEPVQLSIDGQGEIFVGDEAVTEPQLALRLRSIRSASDEKGGPRIYLRADRGLDYGRVMRVMGELDRAGLNRVALVSVGQDGR